MSSNYRSAKPWILTDELWARFAPLIPPRPERDPNKTYKRNPGAGRKRADSRKMLEGILYVLSTGCQWNAVPRKFGGSSTIHRYFQQWASCGFFYKAWQAGVIEYARKAGIDLDWQSIDGAMTKAPLGGEATGPNPTDRGKKGTKRHLLVDGKGIPLSLAVSGANVHDSKCLAQTLSANIIELPLDYPKHLCADAAYAGMALEEIIIEHGYIPHVRSRGEEKVNKVKISGYRARRWVVEACHSWLNRFRKILVRFEKTLESHLALLHFAFALICWKKVI